MDTERKKTKTETIIYLSNQINELTTASAVSSSATGIG